MNPKEEALIKGDYVDKGIGRAQDNYRLRGHMGWIIGQQFSFRAQPTKGEWTRMAPSVRLDRSKTAELPNSSPAKFLDLSSGGYCLAQNGPRVCCPGGIRILMSKDGSALKLRASQAGSAIT